MRIKSFLFLAIASSTVVAETGSWKAFAANDRGAFPENYRQGEHYATVNRGTVREEIVVSREAIAAARNGQPLPDGTIITMEDYRGGAFHRYVVMEKRAGWGDAHPPGVRTGDWEFREFGPDRSPNPGESGARCMSCHLSQANDDFVFTYDRMRGAK